VVADFAQLVPGRSAVVTADPYHPSRLRLTVSGVAPDGPQPRVPGVPARSYPATAVTVTVQSLTGPVENELGWQDVPEGDAIVTPSSQPVPELVLWTGTVDLKTELRPGRLRLLIREYEYHSAAEPVVELRANGEREASPPKRPVYAEAFVIDAALISPLFGETGTTV
jgi:hypothetical protein